MLIPEFKSFGKIERYNKQLMTITEKIDGTNGVVYVPDNPEEPLIAGSRNRWLTEENDNYGFAKWVGAMTSDLRTLGPGYHYGEWWGAGIQRKYGLSGKRFSLFSAAKYASKLFPSVVDSEVVSRELAPSIEFVPVLYSGPINLDAIESEVVNLFEKGSVAVPGWMQPEGVVINLAGRLLKITDNGDGHKGAVVAIKK